MPQVIVRNIGVITKKSKEMPIGKNPLYNLIGIAKNGKEDGSEKHDKYLNDVLR